MIKESYKNYNPPKSVYSAIERLLSAVDQKRLIGLRSVILTNSKALNHMDRRKKLDDCNGWYQRKGKKEPAYIELLIDNILSGFPKWVIYFNVFLDDALSETLYHEIGHHIHRTQVPEFSESENIAEKWKSKLQKYYFRRRYWYVIAVLYPFKPILMLIKKYKNRNNNTIFSNS